MKIIVSLVLFFAFSFSNATSILIDLRSNAFKFNRHNLQALDKFCVVINGISSGSWSSNARKINPLIVYKVFKTSDEITLQSAPRSSLSNDDFVISTVIPKLSSETLKTVNDEHLGGEIFNIDIFDSLIIYDGKEYRYIPGVAVVEYFNIVSINPEHGSLTNSSTFNLCNNPIPLYLANDSLYHPKTNKFILNVFLTAHRDKDDFTFFRHPAFCSHCDFYNYNEYVFREGVGVIAFKSLYFYYPEGNLHRSYRKELFKSTQYYYFK